ncbi:uncharacterized protein LOC122280693 isoform X2 [Carya illinoinensis]|uniref:uncharacterized protein LOC122280693 isoform X2 n=1 Tax=Carya illinoinensis TaxID=32201 RepID=UPI001C71F682|nr:uncharacterized protein LOC122280693 isoform X2 [Carya illinoinensis]
MVSKAFALVKLLFSSHHLLSFPGESVSKPLLVFTTATYSTESPTQVEVVDHPKNSIDVLRKWGCSDDDILKIIVRRPYLGQADIANLQSKLNMLSGLGIGAHDLVKMINSSPRIKPAFAQYQELGVSRKDLIPMLLSRPTMIPRTSFDEEKMEYIRKTGISKDSKMYKYVVTIISISRHETIRQKLGNFEKFGFSEDEIFNLFGRSPLMLTLSVDKVQRNMTFVLGTMKLPASVVLQYPFLLYSNLETVLKPRVLLAGKIDDMGLDSQIKGPTMLRALRMTEMRFLKVFVKCHPKDVADELLEFYKCAKGIKRLAEASKKNIGVGFPF